MGPESAEKALREALALGCDEAFLLTGQEFAASDTYATAVSYTHLDVYKRQPLILCHQKINHLPNIRFKKP